VYLLNSLISKGFINRPVLFAGLLFFFLYCRPIKAAEFPSYKAYRSTVISDVPDLHKLPDSSQVTVSTEYNPVLFEFKDTSADNYNTRIQSVDSKVGFFWHGERYDFFATGSYSGFSGALRDDNIAYEIENCRYNGLIVGGLTYHTNRLSLSGEIGRVFAESVKRELWSTVTDSTGVYLSKSPWLVACAAKLVLKNISLSAGASSGPVHSSISKIVNRESGSYRNFPVYLLKRNLQAGIEGAFPSVHFDVDFGFDVFRTADMITTSNTMPQDIAINAYNVQGKLWLKTRFTDSLFCDVNGGIAGGAVASYNFNRDRMTMFESDSLMIRSGNVLCGMSLPRGFTLGAAASRVHLTMPAGYLRLSAFSNWSVFKPMDYRFSDASLMYTEMGLFGNREIKFKSVDLCPEIACSYVKVQGECIYERKDIVVLFPVYVDPVKETFINGKYLLITPELKAGVHLGKCDIRGSLSQRIPIELKERRKSGNGGDDSGSRSRKSRFYGGGRLLVSVVRYF
jgi:hypothetical protein